MRGKAHFKMHGGRHNRRMVYTKSERKGKKTNKRETMEGPIGEPHSTRKCAKLRTTEKRKRGACTVNQWERSGNAQGT